MGGGGTQGLWLPSPATPRATPAGGADRLEALLLASEPAGSAAGATAVTSAGSGCAGGDAGGGGTGPPPLPQVGRRLPPLQRLSVGWGFTGASVVALARAAGPSLVSLEVCMGSNVSDGVARLLTAELFCELEIEIVFVKLVVLLWGAPAEPRACTVSVGDGRVGEKDWGGGGVQVGAGRCGRAGQWAPGVSPPQNFRPHGTSPDDPCGSLHICWV